MTLFLNKCRHIGVGPFRFLGSLASALLLTIVLSCAALASAPIAVIKSAKNAQAYQYQNIGSFDEDWQTFKRTVEAANLRFETLGDNEITAQKLAPYKVVIFPLVTDIAPESLDAIRAYVNGGGRILLTDGGGQPTPAAADLLALAGAQVQGHASTQEAQQFVWPRSPEFAQEFAVGTLIANVTTTNGGISAAKWLDPSKQSLGDAMTKRNGGLYIGWAPGLQGETTTNISVLTMALDELSPGLSRSSTVSITGKDYLKYQEELDSLRKRTESAIATARQADLPVPFRIVQKHFDSALTHTKSFTDYYQQGKFFEADGELTAARTQFSLAYAQAMPVRLVEARNIWLDRGTIVACSNEQGMAQLFDRLKRSGINVVYFETNNAGFTMYPSKVSTQNPQTIGWDPLGCAVREAHKRGMEIHAWFWTFSVGNTFHNPIIKEDPEYPGPVLSKPEMDLSWALASARGALVPPKQHEFWLDPSAPEARKFIKSLIMEAVKAYDLDGVQLDYIRYPFNGKGGEMGFNWASRLRFEKETRLALDRMDERCRKAFQDWKVKQVSSFVADMSSSLRAAKPGIRISAAVYALPRAQRLTSIQQDWETWVANGWVDTLNPMTYVTRGSELSMMASFVRESTQDKAMVYPGLFIKDLDTAGFVEQLDVSRSVGTMGNTMFAVAQLDDKKAGVLELGPYRRPPLMTPQSDPVRAATIVFDGFARSISRYIQDPERPIVSDRALTNDVLFQIDQIQQKLHALPSTPTALELQTLSASVSQLDAIVKEWLSIESFVKRAPRAQYITSYIGQASSLLAYAAHKSAFKSPAVLTGLKSQAP